MTSAQNIVVIGTGHVGLVTVATMASFGHQVVGLDVNAETITRLLTGEVHFYEPGLEALFKEGLEAGRITLTTDPALALEGADIAMICVGTPSDESGLGEELDLSMVQSAVRTVITHASGPIVIVEKSTVPPGTGDRIEGLIDLYRPTHPITVASNPEFLREGQAVADTLRPDRIVVGANDEQTHAVMRRLYEPQLAQHDCPYVATDRATAEIIKQASNAFLATKISFINEIARLCEVVGADVSMVAEGMGHDHRIGRAFLNAGLGYGGSCFPKDVAGLYSVFTAHQVDSALVGVLPWANEQAMNWPIRVLQEALWGFNGRCVAILGASFKPHTDDIRSSIAIHLAQELADRGVSVRITDPVALNNAREALGGHGDRIVFADSPEVAITGADAVILATEWPEYAQLDPADIARWLETPIAIDGRIQWDGEAFEAQGLQFFQVGRRANR